MSRDDSRLLASSLDIFANDTLRTILDVNPFFQQLYILSVRKELPAGGVLSYSQGGTAWLGNRKQNNHENERIKS